MTNHETMMKAFMDQSFRNGREKGIQEAVEKIQEKLAFLESELDSHRGSPGCDRIHGKCNQCNDILFRISLIKDISGIVEKL